MKAIAILFLIWLFSGCTQESTPEELQALQKKGDWKRLIQIMTEDPNPLIRAQVPYYLSQMENPDVVLALVEALKRRETVNSASRALTKLQAIDAIPNLMEAFRSPYGNKKALLQDIAQFTPKTQPFLVEVLQSEDWNLKTIALGCLSEHGNISTVPALQELAKKITVMKVALEAAPIQESAEEKAPTEKTPVFMEFMLDEISLAIDKIKFRHQMENIENLTKLGWKTSQLDTYTIPCKVYFQKIGYIKAYQSEWNIPKNMLGFTFAESTPEFSEASYYLGRGTVSIQKNALALDGFYYLATKQQPETTPESWNKMSITITELIYNPSNKTFYFMVLPKGKNIAEPMYQNTIKEFLETLNSLSAKEQPK